jgi:hypothetical protein
MPHGRKEMGGGDRRSGSGAVGGVVADAKHSAGPGDAGAGGAGRRGRRKHPGPCATAAAHRAHHPPVAASLREPGFGRPAQSATGRAAAAHHRGQRAGSRQRPLRKPRAATHWSARRLAKEVGLSAATVHRIWRKYGLQPHRAETFKFSRDPRCEHKLAGIVGLHLDPPERAVVLCVDEKSRIQALNRTRRVLPMWPGLPARMTHDYTRHGATSLFAALEVAGGKVHARCFRRHRHLEFIAFLNSLARRYAGREPRLICDNYGTRKHPAVKQWLTAHPRFHLHFTPASASWLNLVGNAGSP